MEDLRIGMGVGWARRYPFAVFCFLPLFQRCTFELSWSLLIIDWLCIQRQMSVQLGLCILS